MSDNPSGESFPFHLGNPGIMTTDKQFSIHVSKTLDVLGKNQDMVKYRVKTWMDWQEFHNEITRRLQFEEIVAGSKAEGLTSTYESDRDSMLIFPDVICADNVRYFIQNSNTTVFQTDKHDSPAGYTKLKLVKYEGQISISVLDYSLFNNENEDKYLSSDLLVTTIEQGLLKRNKNPGLIIRHVRSGPSLPVSNIEGYLHEDKVYSLRCVCPSLLHTFLTRSRPHNQPSRDELCDISVMDAHVVPVGHKGSNELHNEWRICFTKAELYLVQRLNETGTKLYIILKMVSKLLKLISKDITSYVMKNIVLWLVELYPIYLFTEDLLTYQLIQALRFLHNCVAVNFLPSYMIPERNLLSDLMNPTQKLELTTFLSLLIQERGYVLLRCEKLRNGMMILYREPDMAEKFRMRRDMVDKLSSLLDKIKYEKKATTGLSEEEVKILIDAEGTKDKIMIPLTRLLFPDTRFLRRQGCSLEEFCNLGMNRFYQMLS